MFAGAWQPTAVNTPGSATVNLRGLGTNRNVGIIDGRRAMPVNASLSVDLNSIPSAAVERVEIITGGASSTYGADAVGGVVNFWDVTDTLSVRGGVDNLFDKEPPVTRINTIADNGMNGGSFTPAGGGLFDLLGRRCYVGLRARF